MNVKEILQNQGLTLKKFAEILKISRPTLNFYIQSYEDTGTVPNQKFRIIFDSLFKEVLPDEIFRKRLIDFERMINRDSIMGVLELDSARTDLFTAVVNNMKEDFKSSDFDEKLYLFINFLISGYHSEPLIQHITKYFLVLNSIVPLDDIDLHEEVYLAHYFSLFFKDKMDDLIYDENKTEDFLNRVKTLQESRNAVKTNVKRKIFDELEKNIKHLDRIGIELPEDELLSYLKNKISKIK